MIWDPGIHGGSGPRKRQKAGTHGPGLLPLVEGMGA
jgi:hypothetical protein